MLIRQSLRTLLLESKRDKEYLIEIVDMKFLIAIFLCLWLMVIKLIN